MMKASKNNAETSLNKQKHSTLEISHSFKLGFQTTLAYAIDHKSRTSVEQLLFVFALANEGCTVNTCHNGLRLKRLQFKKAAARSRATITSEVRTECQKQQRMLTMETPRKLR